MLCVGMSVFYSVTLLTLVVYTAALSSLTARIFCSVDMDELRAKILQLIFLMYAHSKKY